VSLVIEYLKLTYSNCCYDSHSWTVINSAMQKALEICIEGRFEFSKEDFDNLSKTQSEVGYRPNGQFGFWKWVGKDTHNSCGERLYKLAIDSNNKSACISFEYWKKRKPFIFKGHRLGVGSSVQLLINEKLTWWSVGSFSEAGDKINLSSDGKRKSLTVKELKAIEKQREVAHA
jgi:hypothetical protein